MSKRSPNDIDRLVGARLRSLRTVQDRTLAELGAELGISHQQLQKYETGTNRMSAGMLWQASKVLGIRVEEFFDPAPPEAVNDHGLAEGLEKLDLARDQIAHAMRRARFVVAEPANQPNA